MADDPSPERPRVFGDRQIASAVLRAVRVSELPPQLDGVAEHRGPRGQISEANGTGPKLVNRPRFTLAVPGGTRGGMEKVKHLTPSAEPTLEREGVIDGTTELDRLTDPPRAHCPSY